MDNMLLKLFTAILGMIAEIAMVFLKIVLNKTPQVLELPYVQMGIQFSMVIAGCILLCTLMKEVLFKLAGIEGSFEDLNSGEIAIKFLSSIIIIPLLPIVFTFIYNIGFMIINALMGIIVKMIGSFSYGEVSSGNINSALDYLQSAEFISGVVAMSGITAVGIFIFIFILSTMLAISLMFIIVELGFAVILSPIIGASLIKNTDKLNALSESFISMLILFGVQVFAIFWAVSVITNQVADSEDAEGFIFNGILCFVIMAVSSSPTVIGIIAKGRQSSGGAMQKLFYGFSTFNAIKGLIPQKK